MSITSAGFALGECDDVASGKVRIVAPIDFMEESVSENVMLGNAMLLGYLAVRLNGPRAADKSWTFNLQLADPDESWGLEVGNGVLNFTGDLEFDSPDASVSCPMVGHRYRHPWPGHVRRSDREWEHRGRR